MKKMIRLRGNIIFLSVLVISTSALSSTLSCPQILPSGTYTGNFTGIIDKEGWESTNFIFTPIKGPPGCVQFDGDSNKIRYNIIMNAFLLNYKISISVDNLHKITGIGYSNGL